MERRGGQYSVTNCRSDVSAFNLRRSMCRPSKIDVSTFEDRCVDFRRSTIDVPTVEDRWRCRPSKTDDRCEIMLPHLLETLMV